MKRKYTQEGLKTPVKVYIYGKLPLSRRPKMLPGTVTEQSQHGQPKIPYVCFSERLERRKRVGQFASVGSCQPSPYKPCNSSC